MTEKEKKILNVFVALIPKLSELDKEKLLSFGEGMAFKTDLQQEAIKTPSKIA